MMRHMTPHTSRTPRRRLPLLARGLVAALALVAATPALASAGELVHVDPARDTRRALLDDERFTPAPNRDRLDVRRVRVTHDADHLDIRFRTRGPLPPHHFAVVGTIRTPQSTSDLDRSELFGEPHLSIGRAHRDIDCPRLRADRDRVRAVTRIVVPTSCIGNPRWVRVGLGVIGLRGTYFFVDDAFSRRVGDDPVLTRRIHRG